MAKTRLNEPVDQLIKRIEALQTVENPKQQFELKRGTEKQPRLPRQPRLLTYEKK